MKKFILCLALAALILTPALAMAQAQGGGYVGPAGTPMGVVEVLQFEDDIPVYMEGMIVGSKGGELYEFTDGTGTVILEIDAEEWGGLKVGNKDKVGIWGEVDRDRDSFKVDVDRIVKK